MKTITKKYNLYTFDELSKEAKEKALKDYNQNDEYAVLADNMAAERLHELLVENKIKYENDTSKAGTKPTQVYHSLGYCQGDGTMVKEMVLCLEKYFAETCESNGYTFLSSGKMFNE